MSWSVYLAAPLMAVLAVVQSTIISRWPVLGLPPQLLLLVVVAWGLLYGAQEGAIWGFIAGLFLDMFSSAPMGLSSLALMGAVVTAALAQRLLPVSRFFLPMILSALATLIFFAIYLALLQLTGYPINWSATAGLPVAALLHGLFVLPVYWLIHTLGRALSRRQVEI